jgi:predicted small lipoprotein YifL
MKKIILPCVLMFLCFTVAGCGDEGPFGNTPPQGRPDWMKDKDGGKQ